jgi:hypothetical protein
MEPLEPLVASTAKQKYDELYEQHKNSEFRDTLIKIKEACDIIEQKVKGNMSNSAIVAISGHHINTIKPKKSPHHAYVELRKEEYAAKRKPPTTVKAELKEIAVQRPRYPASDLDEKTRSFIEGLWLEIRNLKSRNEMLEDTHTNFKKQVLDQTREKPLDARKMLNSGPDDTGSMNIIVAGGDAPMIPLTPNLREALEAVLQLGKRHPKLRLQKDGRLMLETPSQDVMLLYPHQLRTMAEVIGKEVPGGE